MDVDDPGTRLPAIEEIKQLKVVDAGPWPIANHRLTRLRVDPRPGRPG